MADLRVLSRWDSPAVHNEVFIMIAAAELAVKVPYKLGPSAEQLSQVAALGHDAKKVQEWLVINPSEGIRGALHYLPYGLYLSLSAQMLKDKPSTIDDWVVRDHGYVRYVKSLFALLVFLSEQDPDELIKNMSLLVRHLISAASNEKFKDKVAKRQAISLMQHKHTINQTVFGSPWVKRNTLSPDLFREAFWAALDRLERDDVEPDFSDIPQRLLKFPDLDRLEMQQIPPYQTYVLSPVLIQPALALIRVAATVMGVKTEKETWDQVFTDTESSVSLHTTFLKTLKHVEGVYAPFFEETSINPILKPFLRALINEDVLFAEVVRVEEKKAPRRTTSVTVIDLVDDGSDEPSILTSEQEETRLLLAQAINNGEIQDVLQLYTLCAACFDVPIPISKELVLTVSEELQKGPWAGLLQRLATLVDKEEKRDGEARRRAMEAEEKGSVIIESEYLKAASSIYAQYLEAAMQDPMFYASAHGFPAYCTTLALTYVSLLCCPDDSDRDNNAGKIVAAALSGRFDVDISTGDEEFIKSRLGLALFRVCEAHQGSVLEDAVTVLLDILMYIPRMSKDSLDTRIPIKSRVGTSLRKLKPDTAFPLQMCQPVLLAYAKLIMQLTQESGDDEAVADISKYYYYDASDIRQPPLRLSKKGLTSLLVVFGKLETQTKLASIRPDHLFFDYLEIISPTGEFDKAGIPERDEPADVKEESDDEDVVLEELDGIIEDMQEVKKLEREDGETLTATEDVVMEMKDESPSTKASEEEETEEAPAFKSVSYAKFDEDPREVSLEEFISPYIQKRDFRGLLGYDEADWTPFPWLPILCCKLGQSIPLLGEQFRILTDTKRSRFKTFVLITHNWIRPKTKKDQRAYAYFLQSGTKYQNIDLSWNSFFLGLLWVHEILAEAQNEDRKNRELLQQAAKVLQFLLTTRSDEDVSITPRLFPAVFDLPTIKKSFESLKPSCYCAFTAIFDFLVRLGKLKDTELQDLQVDTYLQAANPNVADAIGSTPTILRGQIVNIPNQKVRDILIGSIGLPAPSSVSFRTAEVTVLVQYSRSTEEWLDRDGELGFNGLQYDIARIIKAAIALSKKEERHTIDLTSASGSSHFILFGPRGGSSTDSRERTTKSSRTRSLHHARPRFTGRRRVV